jgi:uncharacterized protein involved in outer membrane biogenesis
LELRYDICLEVANLEYNLLRLTASARSVSLRLASRGDLPHFLRATQLDVELSLLELLLGGLTIKKARLEGVSIDGVIAKDGRSNLPRWHKLTGSEDDSSETNFLISSLTLTEGSVSLRDESKGLLLEIPEWVLEVKGQPATTPLAYPRIRSQSFEFKTKLSSWISSKPRPP